MFIAPSVIIFMLYRVIPIIWNFILSFQKYNLIGSNEWTGIRNYTAMLTDSVFWESLSNTAFYFAFGTPLAIFFALIIALLVNEKLRGRDIYRTIIFLPYPMSTVAIGIIWKWLYDGKVGLINYILRGLHIIDTPIAFLESFTWSLPSVVITSMWQVVGFYMVILLTGLQTIPNELYEVAEIDGATTGMKLKRITLPLLKPSIFLCFVVGIINSFTMFDLVYVMTGGGPGYSSEILVTHIYKNAFIYNRIGYGAAMTVFLFVMLLIITFIVNKITGEEAGGERYYE